MVPPEEYGKYEYPDYPVKTLPSLVKHFKKNGPEYWEKLRAHVAEHGVEAPALARFTRGGRPLKRPQMMDGHHRAAAAWDLGLHLPVGDYDNQADYDAAAEARKPWFRDEENEQLKAREKSPWRTAAADDGTHREAAAGPAYYHGTADQYEPGDQIEHHYWKKYPDRDDFRENSPLYATTDPSLAGHMAELRGGSEGHLYQVHPTGPVKPDETANGIVRGNASWMTSHPLHVVREVPRHEWPQDLNSWHMSQEEIEQQRENQYSRRHAVSGYDGLTGREAAAEDGPWYHGTQHPFAPGEYVTSPSSRGTRGEWDASSPDHSYASTDKLRAWQLAAGQEHARPGRGPGRVFEVHPAGDMEPDPVDKLPSAFRTRGPMLVGRELPRQEIHEAQDERQRQVREQNQSLYEKQKRPHQFADTGNYACGECGMSPGAPVHSARTAAKGYDLSPRSGMIYLELPPGAVRPVPGGVDDHHVTICYLGKDVDDETFAEACRRAKEAASQSPPLSGHLEGTRTFPPSEGSDNKTVAYVPAFVRGLSAVRHAVEDLNASEFKNYTPHVTLAYLEEGEAVPEQHPKVPVSFTHLHVKRGDDVRSFPFGISLHTAAKNSGPVMPIEEILKLRSADSPGGGTVADVLQRRDGNLRRATHWDEDAGRSKVYDLQDDMAENGQRTPLWIKTHKGERTLMDGHHRVWNAMQLGMTDMTYTSRKPREPKSISSRRSDQEDQNDPDSHA
jgi:2'-5' RNA ligase